MALKAIGTPGAPGNDREALRAQTQGYKEGTHLLCTQVTKAGFFPYGDPYLLMHSARRGGGVSPSDMLMLTQNFNTKNEQVPPMGRALSEGRWPL